MEASRFPDAARSQSWARGGLRRAVAAGQPIFERRLQSATPGEHAFPDSRPVACKAERRASADHFECPGLGARRLPFRHVSAGQQVPDGYTRDRAVLRAVPCRAEESLEEFLVA